MIENIATFIFGGDGGGGNIGETYTGLSSQDKTLLWGERIEIKYIHNPLSTNPFHNPGHHFRGISSCFCPLSVVRGCVVYFLSGMRKLLEPSFGTESKHVDTNL